MHSAALRPRRSNRVPQESPGSPKGGGQREIGVHCGVDGARLGESELREGEGEVDLNVDWCGNFNARAEPSKSKGVVACMPKEGDKCEDSCA